jgi:hypothetical protein
MARLFVTGINLNKNELQNARIHNLSSAPSSPEAGQIYFNTGDNTLYFYNGSSWIPASGSTEVIQDLIGSSLVGGTGLTTTYSDSSGETTIDLDNTAVTHGSYGSSAAKTVAFTVDQQGRLTAASEQDIQIATSQVTGLQEYIEDSVNTVVVAGEGIDVSYNDSANTYTVSAEDASDTNKGVASFQASDFVVTNGDVALNDEAIQDAVGAMLTGNTETGITVTYEDSDGTIDFAVADQFPSHTTSDLAEGTNLYYTEERVQDEIADTIVGGTGIDATYNDGSGTLTIDIDSSVTTNSGTQTLTNKTLGSGTALSSNLDAATYKIVNLGTPTASGDAVNKSYVDGLTAGLDWKTAVHLLYDDSTPTFSGDSTLTPLVIDGHDPLGSSDVGYRVLVKNGDDAGIYVYSQTGTAWTLDRASDGDAYAELVGASVFVMEGDQYGSTSWVQSNHYLTDFTNQEWVQFSGAGTYLAGAGLTLSGNTFSADVTPTSGNASLINTGGAIEVKVNTTDGLEVTTDGLGINNGAGLTFSSGALVLDTANGYGVRKYSVSIGDASATSYTVTHNLGTKDVTVQVYENGSPYAQVETDVEHAGNNTVTIKFASAPISNQYRVVVVG